MRKIAVFFILAMFAACGGTQKPVGKDYADAMHKEHAADTPDGNDAAKLPAGDVEIETSAVAYGKLGESTLNGFIAKPKGEGAYPALIVIHEWWGLNSNIREMTKKLASMGYIALAVDMYGGTAASDPDEAKQLMMTAMAKPDQAHANLAAAWSHLDGLGASKVGVIGWCFGGGWSLKTGVELGDKIDAVVVYYGHVTGKAEELTGLTAPILGVFGALDQGIPLADVKAFEAALDKAGKDAAIHVYENADHAFANPSGQRYQKEAAEDAWAKTAAFLAENLK